MLQRTLLAACLGAGCLLSAPGCRRNAAVAARPEPKVQTRVVEEHWPDGKLRLRREVRVNADGQIVNHGTYTCWYDNGRKEYEATFVDGRIHGVATRWHRNGQKWIEEHFVDGEPHGVRRIWDEDGNLRKEEFHTHGRPSGTWTVWRKDGEVKIRRSFDTDDKRP